MKHNKMASATQDNDGGDAVKGKVGAKSAGVQGVLVYVIIMCLAGYGATMQWMQSDNAKKGLQLTTALAASRRHLNKTAWWFKDSADVPKNAPIPREMLQWMQSDNAKEGLQLTTALAASRRHLNGSTAWWFKDSADVPKNAPIPREMLLVNDRLLWCPAAKAGTSTLYDYFEFKFNLITELKKETKEKKGLSEERKMSKEKATKRLTKKLGRAPDAAEVAAFLRAKIAGFRCAEDCMYSAWKLFRERTPLRGGAADAGADGAVTAATDENDDDNEMRPYAKIVGTVRGGSVLHLTRAVSFTVVRNPWDRLHSAYMGKFVSYLKKHGQPGIKLRHLPESKQHAPTFVEFVQYIEKYPFDNIHFMSYLHRCHTSPDADGNMFHYDHVIRIEDGLEEGLQKVFADLEMGNVDLNYLDTGQYCGMSCGGKTCAAECSSSYCGKSCSGDGCAAKCSGPDHKKKNPDKTGNKNKNTVHTLQIRFDYYRTEAAKANITMDELVATVGRIYKDDVETFDYSFENYS